MILGAIFDGAVFSTKWSQAQFFVKSCSQRPFVENVMALIKMWCLEGISSPLVEKKCEAEAVPYTRQDVTFLKRHFTAFDGKKR